MLDGQQETTMNDPSVLDQKNICIHRLRLTIAGAVWISAVQFFVAQAIVQSRWTTPFSLKTNYISDLGNTTCGVYIGSGAYVCSPWHSVMNASFILQGIIIALGAICARPALGNSYALNVVSVLLWITALGMVGVGIFPEDVNYEAHVLSAGVQFITGNSAMLVLGIAIRKKLIWRRFSHISMALGILGLVATGLFSQGYSLGLGEGGMERVAGYTLPIWMIMTGWLFIRRRVGIL